MNREYDAGHYTTAFSEDLKEGYGALELFRTTKGEKTRIARVVFWDAAGQFYFDACNAEIPLAILEDFVAEAKATINK